MAVNLIFMIVLLGYSLLLIYGILNKYLFWN